jgi:glycosyltransferase involved in cell wall biosynthesis
MLGWEYPPRISGGLGTACSGIVRALASRGVDVELVLPRATGEEDGGGARIQDASRARVSAAPRELESPLRPYLDESAYEAQRSVAPPLRGGYGASLGQEVQRYARAVVELVHDEHYDLIHAHDWMTYPAGLALREELDRPLVCHVHACEYDRSGARPDPRIVAVEERALRASDRVVCVSHYTAGVLSARFDFDESKVRVVHNGVEIETTEDRPGPRRTIPEPIVLFLGRLTGQKAPLAFLDVAALVLREESTVKFVLAGHGDLSRAVIERAAELGIARSVHFTGFLEGPEVVRAYAMADVYVMPSVSEPFGLAPLEAASHGAAVILSRQSGVAEVLASALRVDHWDVEGFARRILLLLRRPDLREALARGARREVARLSWGRAAVALERVYEELAA